MPPMFDYCGAGGAMAISSAMELGRMKDQFGLLGYLAWLSLQALTASLNTGKHKW